MTSAPHPHPRSRAHPDLRPRHALGLGGSIAVALLGLAVLSFGAGDTGGTEFERDVRPLLARYCFNCHGPDEQKADMRLDTLDPDFIAGPHAEHWKTVLDMLQAGEMPPFTEAQPSDAERRLIVAWVRASLDEAARARAGERHAVLRRLNKAQYSATLQELLGVDVDFGRVLPDDGKSAMGFTNNGETLLASSLHVDYYRRLAREALDQAIVTGERPDVSRYRVTFGRDLGLGHVAAETGGYQAVPLSTDDFVLEILGADGAPRKGATDEERAALDRLRRTMSIGLRGSSMDRFRVVDEGLMLYGARPHVEKPPGAWQGPSPNVKLEMQRSFPEKGDLVLRVRASRGYLLREREEVLIALEDAEPYVALAEGGELALRDGALRLVAAESGDRKNLLEDGSWLAPEKADQDSSAHFRVDLPADGFFQIDMVHPYAAVQRMPSARLTIDRSTLDRRFDLEPPTAEDERCVSTLGAVFLERGTHQLRVGGRFFIGFSDLVITPLPADHPAMPRLASELSPPDADEVRTPVMRAFAGTRTDDGMDYAEFAEPIEVTAPFGAPATYEFQGRLEDLPIPEPESGDTEILSGFMLLGIWNDHLVKNADDPGPPLLVESLEFEAPYLPEWPPASHRAIFFDSPARADEAAYTREVVGAFLARAFRRPIEEGEDGELEPYLELWRELRPECDRYEESVREVLVAALCSPSFLFLVEPPCDDDDGDDVGGVGGLAPEALATRLSYFLWSGPPDAELVAAARESALAAQVDRLLDDPRALRFVRTFASEWLRLDRFATMDVNVDVYPDFTRFVKRDMAEETVRFVHHTIAEDLSVFTLIDSDFAMLNQNLAEFYGIPGVVGPHFRPVAVTPEQHRGGLLSQGAILAGHSDGTQAHPIKRAVWLRAKLLGDPPPPPPPNVPKLDPAAPGFEGLTLKEQLERHRDNPSCMDCHRGIDPYGFAFERYDATGRWHAVRADGEPIDATSVLPDGAEVDDVRGLKAYLLEQRSDDFVAALIEYVFAYALGRDVHFGDEEELLALRERVRAEGDTMRAVIRAVVASPSFTGP